MLVRHKMPSLVERTLADTISKKVVARKMIKEIVTMGDHSKFSFETFFRLELMSRQSPKGELHTIQVRFILSRTFDPYRCSMLKDDPRCMISGEVGGDLVIQILGGLIQCAH